MQSSTPAPAPMLDPDEVTPADTLPVLAGKVARLERLVGEGSGDGLRAEIPSIDRALRSLTSELRNERHARRLHEQLRREETEDWQALQEAWHELHSDQAFKGRLWSGFLAVAVMLVLLATRLA